MEYLHFESPKYLPNTTLTIGIGKGGTNAVKYIKNTGIYFMDFLILNTDLHSDELSFIENKNYSGPELPQENESGSIPDFGYKTEAESITIIKNELINHRLAFIIAGLGGNAGTKAAPVVAAMAKESGLLTIGVVTMPFLSEGVQKLCLANEGIESIKKHVDLLIIISNDHLIGQGEKIPIPNSCTNADHMMSLAVKSIFALSTAQGHCHIDFFDLSAFSKNSGVGFMTIGAAQGRNRAMNAVKKALSPQLMISDEIRKSKRFLVYIVSGNDDTTEDELVEMLDYIQETTGRDIECLWDFGHDSDLGESIRITIIGIGCEYLNSLNYQIL